MLKVLVLTVVNINMTAKRCFPPQRCFIAFFPSLVFFCWRENYICKRTVLESSISRQPKQLTQRKPNDKPLDFESQPRDDPDSTDTQERLLSRYFGQEITI